METRFIGREYVEIKVEKKYVHLYEEGYSFFGWEKIYETYPSKLSSSKIVLQFQRDRKIRNKVELIRLQKQFDSTLSKILYIEKHQKTLAKVISTIVGIIGCGFMALSVFAIDSQKLSLSVLWGVAGSCCWLSIYFIYKKILAMKSEKVKQSKEREFNTLYEVGERATRLL